VTGPLFHVQRGHPTPEELAALTAVLAAKAQASAAARRRHAAPPPWGDPAAAHRRPLPPPGHVTWRGLWTAAGAPFAARLRSPSGGPGDGGWGSSTPGSVRGGGTLGSADA
jgi:hypothetical protein